MTGGVVALDRRSWSQLATALALVRRSGATLTGPNEALLRTAVALASGDDPDHGPDQLTVDQAAARAGRSRSTIYRWMKAGLPSSGTGVARRIARADLDRWTGQASQSVA